MSANTPTLQEIKNYVNSLDEKTDSQIPKKKTYATLVSQTLKKLTLKRHNQKQTLRDLAGGMTDHAIHYGNTEAQNDRTGFKKMDEFGFMSYVSVAWLIYKHIYKELANVRDVTSLVEIVLSILAINEITNTFGKFDVDVSKKTIEENIMEYMRKLDAHVTTLEKEAVPLEKKILQEYENVSDKVHDLEAKIQNADPHWNLDDMIQKEIDREDPAVKQWKNTVAARNDFKVQGTTYDPDSTSTFSNGLIFTKLKESRFIHLLSNLCLTLAGIFMTMKIIPAEGESTIGTYFKKFAVALTAISAADCIFKLATVLIEDVYPAIMEGDINHLKSDVLRNNLHSIVQFSLLPATGWPMEGMVSIVKLWNNEDIPEETFPNRLDMLLKMYKIGQEMLEYVKRVVSRSGDGTIAPQVNQILMALNNLRVTIQSTERLQPFCFGIAGPSRCGKTMFCNSLLRAALVHILDLKCERRGDCFYPIAQYTMAVDKFQSNYGSDIDVIGFDDISIMPMKNGSDVDLYNQFMGIQGNVPFVVPKPDIEGKFGCFYNNKLTWVTTNFTDYNIKGRVNEPAAFLNRFDVRVEIGLEEFMEDKVQLIRMTAEVFCLDYSCENKFTSQMIKRVMKTMEDRTELYIDIAKIVVQQATLFKAKKQSASDLLAKIGQVCGMCKQSRMICKCVANLKDPALNDLKKDVPITTKTNYDKNINAELKDSELKHKVVDSDTIKIKQDVAQINTEFAKRYNVVSRVKESSNNIFAHLLAKQDDGIEKLFLIFLSTFVEEIFWFWFLTLFGTCTLGGCIIDPTNLMIYIGCRLLIDVNIFLMLPKPPIWYIGHLFCLYLSLHSFWVTSLTIHILWNMLALSDYFMYGLVHVGNKALLPSINHMFRKQLIFTYDETQHTIMLQLNYRNLFDPDQLREIMYEQVDIKVNSKWPYLVFAVTVAASFLTYKWFIDAIFKNSNYTAIGDQPLKDDIDETKRFEEMIKGNYKGSTKGKTNHYAQSGLKFDYTKSNGSTPTAVSNNVVHFAIKHTTNLGKIMLRTCYGFFNQGRFMTSRHAFDNLGQENTVTATFINCNQENTSFSVDIHDPTYAVGYHDVLMFPGCASKKNIRMNMFYEYGVNHVYLINGEKCKPIAVQNETICDYGNGEKAKEPFGGIVTDFKSPNKISGHPVFIIHDGEKDVDPVLIGVVSRATNKENYTVFVPFNETNQVLMKSQHSSALAESGFQYEMLTEEIDVNDVRRILKRDVSLLDTISSRSVLNHIPIELLETYADYVGTLEHGIVKNMNTNFVESDMLSTVVTLHPDIVKYAPPNMHKRVVEGEYINAYLACNLQWASSGTIINQQPWIDASVIVFKFLFDVCATRLLDLQPFNIFQTIRGNMCTQPINMKSSSGFPNHGVKAKHFKGTFEEPVLTAATAKRLSTILLLMDKYDDFVLNVVEAQQKDEITTIEKSDDGLIRVFYAGAFDYYFLSKMYLQPLFEIMMQERDKMPCQVGMNAVGEEFQERLWSMFKHNYPEGTFEEFKNNYCWWDTDFSKFDKKTTTNKYAASVMWMLMKDTPYYKTNPIEKKRLYRMLQGYSQYIVVMDKDVLLLKKGQGSGVTGTTTGNSINEHLIEVTGFHFIRHLHIHKDVPKFGNFVSISEREEPFHSKVSLINLGDDNLKNLHPDVIPYFTEENVKKFSEFLKMEITTASKKEVKMQMKKLTEIIFLKRTPVYIESLERFMGCLNLTSIYKSLCWTDSTVSDWKQAVVNQAKRELSLHPCDEYNKFCEAFNISEKQEDVQKQILNYNWSPIINYTILDDTSVFQSHEIPALADTKRVDINSKFLCQFAWHFLIE